MTEHTHNAVAALSDAELTAEVRRIFPEIRADLEALARIPSVAFPGFDPSQVQRSAEATAELFRAAGLPDVLLATLHDDAGDVAVEGLVGAGPTQVEMSEKQLRHESSLLDGVSLIGTGSLTERVWHKPAVSVIGIDCPSVKDASNTLVAAARAKVSMRVAPGQDPEAAMRALTDHLTARAPWGAQVSVARGETGAAYAIDATGPAYDAARDAFREAWDGTATVDIGVGG